MLEEVTRKCYNYRGYRGVWIDTGDEGMTENKTPYVINREGVGVATPTLRERVLTQYAPELRKIYGDPLRSEAFLTTFHFAEHDQRLSIGRTLIQDIYGNMEEALEMASQAAELWKTLAGKIDQRRYEYTLKTLLDYVEEVRRTRDKMATSFEAHTGRMRVETLSGLTAEALVQVDTYNVRHFGAVADGTSNDAAAINRAITVCNAAGGGTVFVPSGIYATDSIHLKSNVTLALDAGAVLEFSFHDADTFLLAGQDLENVKIYGPGTLNGMDNTCIDLNGCENTEIRNLNIYNGGNSAILVEGCDGLFIDNIDLQTDRDGINLSECRNVRVSNCRIDAVRREYGRPVGGGEAIKVDGRTLPSESVTLQGCFLRNGGNPIQ